MESFEQYRGYLFAIAYRMLGSAMDAEDVVQETYLRYQGAAPQTINSLKAYLTTITTRLCMDQLQLARRKREQYVGPWLPEPIHTDGTPDVADPEQRVEAQESISLAFMVLLEQLQPFERAVFLLREIFDYEFAEIAAMLDRSEAATRRSFSRAKEHLRAHRPRFPASAQTHRRLLNAYYQAVQNGDMAALTSVLAENVVLWADGGGKARSAVLHPIHGREAVARLSVKSRRFWPEHYTATMEQINGETALVIREDGTTFALITVEVEQEHLQTIRIIVNPEKLVRI